MYRVDHTENESYWIPGFKTFRSVVPNPTSKVIYTTDKQPVQSMWWGDYSITDDASPQLVLRVAAYEFT